MTRKLQAGFTLLEMMVSLVVLLAVSAIVMSGMVQMMKTQGTIANRTEMHTSVRSATELLQQEIGQAGKISLPTPPPGVVWAMLTQVNVPPNSDIPVTPLGGVTFNVVSPATALVPNAPVLFEGEWITVDTGLNKETVQLTCPAGKGACPFTSNNWNATFYYSHLPIDLGGGVFGVPIRAPGAFSTGIVPPAVGVLATPPVGYAGYPDPLTTEGSTGTVLKLYGDINGDGNMIYVEYTCDWQNKLGNGPMLYRNQMDFQAPVKPAITTAMALLTNLDPQGNPNDQNGNAVPCFTYQVQTKDGVNAAKNDMVFVTDVAVTLTVDTQNTDTVTHKVQVETKALLNVSPRNVYQAFEFSQYDYLNRIQITPSVLKTNLLP
jgi:prepilin-type N-terminal cleavage/methylation domain-containing protein